MVSDRFEKINNNYDNDDNTYQSISDLSVYVCYFLWAYSRY